MSRRLRDVIWSFTLLTYLHRYKLHVRHILYHLSYSSIIKYGYEVLPDKLNAAQCLLRSSWPIMLNTAYWVTHSKNEQHWWSWSLLFSWVSKTRRRIFKELFVVWQSFCNRRLHGKHTMHVGLGMRCSVCYIIQFSVLNAFWNSFIYRKKRENKTCHTHGLQYWSNRVLCQVLDLSGPPPSRNAPSPQTDQ